jgi:phosphatidylglycerophosphatase A
VARWVATGFGVGTAAPFAPGTFGTLLAMPLYLIVSELTSPVGYAATVAVMFLFGVWICDIAERQMGSHDHGAIVWDEIVGYFITMAGVSVDYSTRGWFFIALGFGLFRLFDIWKPYPVNIVDRGVPGGLGTMLDDALAGVYAFLVLQVIDRFVIPY